MSHKIFFLIGMFTLLLLLAARTSYAQQLSGKIYSRSTQSGIPATLSFNNHKMATDGQGHFNINRVTFPLQLRVSALNYLTLDTLLLQPENSLLLYLKPIASQLDEVLVSTGYQQVKKEQLTGSVQQISAVQLREQVSVNVLSRLEAIGSGLDVDRSTTDGRITIRGLSSINGPKEVLVVLDNFPYEGDLNNINPADVESITLLKDAAASSIWGSRAGNGVIVITTKKGRYNEAVKIQAQALASIVQKPNLFRFARMGSSDYIDVEQFLFKQGFYNDAYNDSYRPGLSPVVETLFDSGLSETEKQHKIDGWRGLDVRNDFDRLVYRPGLNQQYSLNLNAGTARYNWLLNGGYDQNKDNLNANFKRLNLRYGLNLKLITGLEASVSMAYTDSRSGSGRDGYGTVASYNGQLYPYAQLADAQGNALPIVNQYRLSYLQALDPRLLDWKYYPLTDSQYSTSNSTQSDLNLNAGLHYTLENGLGIQLLYRFERQQSKSDQLWGAESYAARDLVNNFTQLNDNELSYVIPKGGIDNINHARLTAHDIRLQGSYQKNFGAHHLNVLLGGERRELINAQQSSRYYGFDPNQLNVGAVDLVNPYNTFISGGESYVPDGQGLGLTNNRYVSAYANLGYDYKNTYLLYGSVRRDASNLFGVNTNNKWKPLWSAGIGWIVGNTFKLPKQINYFKLRASYGFSGNADPAQTGLTTISYNENSPYTQSPYARITRFANPDLRWETVQTFNAGIDFRFFTNRISGSVDYYRKKGSDLFGIYPVDYTAGTGPELIKNVASMHSRGIDLSIQSQNINEGKFRWQTTFNVSSNKDEVTKYYSVAANGSAYIGTGSITGLVGKPVYAVFSYKYAGLNASGDPVGFLGGLASTDYTALTGSGTSITDLVFSGSVLPTIFGNLGNQFTYKNFGLTVALSYKLGYYFRKNSIQYSNLVGSGIGHPDYALRWQHLGDELHTTVPAFQYPVDAARSNFYSGVQSLVEKADHVRLQYINFDWQLPLAMLKKQAASVRVFANCNNVGLLWAANRRRIDPDYNEVLPPARTFSLGLQINY
ncbi:TonB-linked SusC/RagA family outer membrane protein [Pedobacter sp. UYEF25]